MSKNRNLNLEWLSHELDGALDARERGQLEASLASDAKLRQERLEWKRLDSLLASSQLPVEADFRRRVMASLPAAGWESRHPRSWRWAVAILLLLGGSSAALVGAGSARAAGGGAMFGAARSVLDLFVSSALAGAGLLAASWKGIGVAMGDLFAKPASFIGLALFVVLLNLLFLSLLRGGRRTAQPAHGAAGGSGQPQRKNR